MTTEQRYLSAMNRLAKWRALFAGWQLGTRPDSDPECAAVRDYQEARLLQRAELTAITNLLIEKGICTVDELRLAMAAEADAYNDALEKKFPGVVATDIGLTMDKRVLPWMKGWKP